MGDSPANNADLCREMEALAVLLKQMSMHLDQLAQTTEPQSKISSTELDKLKKRFRTVTGSLVVFMIGATVAPALLIARSPVSPRLYLICMAMLAGFGGSSMAA